MVEVLGSLGWVGRSLWFTDLEGDAGSREGGWGGLARNLPLQRVEPGRGGARGGEPREGAGLGGIDLSALMDVAPEDDAGAGDEEDADCDSDGAGDVVGGELAAAGQAITVAGSAWQLDSDSEAESSSSDGEIGSARGDVPCSPQPMEEEAPPGGAVASGGGLAAEGVRLSVRAVAVAEDVRGARGGAPDGPRRDRRAPFPKIIHSVAGSKQSYLRLSQTVGNAWSDMRAVCGRHAVCSVSRSCRIHRPVGYLWAWLDAADACVSKEEHVAFVPDFATRRSARDVFSAIPGTEDWLQAEAQGEGERP